ncbi:Hsp20/alpha crystallin family protein [Dongia sp. agr-C8]
MTESTKLPIKSEDKGKHGVPRAAVHPFEALRREMNRLIDDFDVDFWSGPFRRATFDVAPFWRRELGFGSAPAVDIAETDKAFEITADLPGMDEKHVEVTLSNGTLSIKGTKQEETEEKKKDYYLHERSFGSFERSFRIPETVDANKIEAVFNKGVLNVKLPKKAEAQQPEKKIAIKAA